MPKKSTETPAPAVLNCVSLPEIDINKIFYKKEFLPVYNQEINTDKQQKKVGKIPRFFSDAFSGKHLLRSIEKWWIWVVAVVLIVVIAVWNENAIASKEKRNKDLQNKYDSIVVEFKIRNEIIYTEDEDRLRQRAREMGFVPTPDNAYYKIEVANE